ncbi:hypothetical protein AAFF_G00044110 [Aldrovandia affinis]|uniref:Uncharacterized protein n=1 Tax=Aldrovandia affinis TaxID=143900 RepID=A0AAD7S2D4_9TELE|nr:hypothetical protein AAFF_G00044110 [Aldrovandia affinis]
MGLPGPCYDLEASPPDEGTAALMKRAFPTGVRNTRSSSDIRNIPSASRWEAKNSDVKCLTCLDFLRSLNLEAVQPPFETNDLEQGQAVQRSNPPSAGPQTTSFTRYRRLLLVTVLHVTLRYFPQVTRLKTQFLGYRC